MRAAPARRRTDLGRGGRFLAACLASIWLIAGLAAVGIWFWLQHAPLPIILGLLAMVYGWVWIRVAITGEWQRWPPWNRRDTP
jgi:hypothetical protein